MRPASGTAPRVPVTRTCTGTSWSPTWPAGVDGRWSALDGTALYAAKRTAGVMFQAAMRRELTARLGVEWGPQHRDTAEIAGVPARVLREFSRRSEQIAEWMDTRGVEGQPAKDEALLATRSPKRSGNADSIEADWVARATNLGWGPAELETLLAAAPGPMAPAREEWVISDVTWRAGEPTITTTLVGFDDWLDWLLTTRLTAHEGTFTRFEPDPGDRRQRPARHHDRGDGRARQPGPWPPPRSWRSTTTGRNAAHLTVRTGRSPTIGRCGTPPAL